VKDSPSKLFSLKEGGATMEKLELLTINEMGEKLRVPLSWLYSRTSVTRPGSIPRIKVGKYIRFVESDVIEWLVFPFVHVY
jgi:predicted DNA-binding transcriptional regulator AlpA